MNQEVYQNDLTVLCVKSADTISRIENSVTHALRKSIVEIIALLFILIFWYSRLELP